MIKLDWDNFSNKKMLDKVEEIKKFGFPRKITVYSSPSLDGYHVEIIPFFKLKPKAVFQYRYNFGDDLNRLCLDMLSDDNSVRNVLFNYKIKTKGGKSMKFERKELFKYTRETTNSEWQKIQNPKSIKSFKLESLQLQLS
mgnify:CR=1 FL=1|tara:strand:- start:679 stop:1098 length:420 start_codon:yes stop_codon:yes gene_type:complete